MTTLQESIAGLSAHLRYNADDRDLRRVYADALDDLGSAEAGHEAALQRGLADFLDAVDSYLRPFARVRPVEGTDGTWHVVRTHSVFRRDQLYCRVCRREGTIWEPRRGPPAVVAGSLLRRWRWPDIIWSEEVFSGLVGRRGRP